MAELKTKVNDASVNKFLDSIEEEAKRKDSYLLFKMMQKATKNEARMWGTASSVLVTTIMSVKVVVKETGSLQDFRRANKISPSTC